MEPAATRDSLLDAAEKLFSEHGLEAASLRAITAAAGANLAAVNYHFGSKQGLVRAVIARRAAPITAERLRRLEAARAAGQGVEEVVRAFVEPVLRMVDERPDGACLFARILGQTFGDGGEEIRAILVEELKGTVGRFADELARLLPELEPEEIFWRLHFMAGTMAHAVAGRQMLEHYSGGACRMSDADVAIEQMVRFVAAGFRAPTLAQPSKEKAAAGRAAKNRRQSSARGREKEERL
jgi:AcrR family transcriptional regulator